VLLVGRLEGVVVIAGALDVVILIGAGPIVAHAISKPSVNTSIVKRSGAFMAFPFQLCRRFHPRPFACR